MTATTPGSEVQAEHTRVFWRSLTQIRPEVTYFALTLRDSHGRLERSVQSQFAGFPEGVGPGEGVELREASEVYPDKMTKMWENVGHDWIVVNDVAQIRVFVSSADMRSSPRTSHASTSPTWSSRICASRRAQLASCGTTLTPRT